MKPSGCEPAGRGFVDLTLPCLVEEEVLADEVAEDGMHRQPRIRSTADDDEPAALEPCEQVSRRRGADGLAELGAETVELGGDAEQLPHLVRLALEHLLREVGTESVAASAELGKPAGAFFLGNRLQHLRGQLDGGGPAGRELVDRAAELGADDPAGLVGGEGEHRRVDVEHLALPAEAVDRERRLVPGGEDQMELGRRLPDEALEQRRRSAGAELVHVVEHEHLVACRLLLEPLSQDGRKRSRARAVLASGERIFADLELEGVGQPARERGKRPVAAVHQIPAPAALGRDRRNECRLAESGARDDRRQPPSFRFVEQAFERGPADVRGRETRRRELDAWSLQKPLGG